MTVELHIYRQRTNPDRTVQAIYFTSWAIHGAALTYWIKKLGFDCYPERDKIVIRPGRRRDEVVVRPGYWLVFDMANPNRACQVQVWRNGEFDRTFRFQSRAASA